MSFASIPELLDELRAGRMVVIVDDEDRENEGHGGAAGGAGPRALTEFLVLLHGRPGAGDSPGGAVRLVARARGEHPRHRRR